MKNLSILPKKSPVNLRVENEKTLHKLPCEETMMKQDTTIDCVLIGYNEVHFSSLWNAAKQYDAFSGKQWALMLETIEHQGERVPYNILLNDYITQEKDKETNLHVWNVPNLAVCYLYSYLKKRKFNVEFIKFFTEEKQRLASLLNSNPKSVAITTTFYYDSAPIIEIVRFIKQHNPDTKIIVGGPHIYNLCFRYQDRLTLQDAVLQEIGADIYVNDSQGELTLSLILHELKQPDAPDFNSIPNLIFQKGDSLCRTVREPENNSLDDNAIDWSHFDRSYLGPTVPVRTARSCAYKCAFCNYPYFAGPLNLTSLDVVEKELSQLSDAGIRQIMFIDDTFNIPLPRFKKLCKIMIERKFGFDWFSFFRCSNADDETFDLMQESGCKGVFLGIESGDQTILNKMNKEAKIERYKYGIQKLKEHDIITLASFIMGFPGETRETALNTLTFIEETAPMFYRILPYYHYPSTPIAKQAKEYGIQGGGYSWKHDTMDWREACGLINMMYRTIRQSIIIPTHSFDFWMIPYLMGHGISIDELKQFLEYAQDLLLKSLQAPPQSHDLLRVSETPQRTALREADLHPTFGGQAPSFPFQGETHVKSGRSG